jgi:hypothetical protein
VQHTDRWLDVLFGMGDDTHPYWLMGVRVAILLFLACAAIVAAHDLGGRRWNRDNRLAAACALALTVLAGGLRFLVAGDNLLDFGGIPYSRLLLGYKGHFATAQFYSLLYGLVGRDIEHAILFNRIAGTLTIPLVYVSCRQLWRDPRVAALAGFLFAISPVHIIFSASDALSIFSIFLTASSYVLIAGAVRSRQPDAVATVRWLGGLLGLVLLTQVRYENALFLIPAVLYTYRHRRHIAPRPFVAPLVFASVLLVFFAYAALTAGLSYQNPVRIWPGVEMVWRHVLWNPITAAPVLLLGCAAVPARAGWRCAVLAQLPWLAALGLPVMAESGHGAVRVYCSWLILLLPAAAFGFAALLAVPRFAARATAAAALTYLTVLPLLALPAVTARHLEIREHDFFRAVVASLDPRTSVLVIPDDELLRRRFGSTIELFNKYSMTLAGLPDVGRRVRLVKLTEFLEGDRWPACDRGECVFFRGLPCLEQSVYPFSREQCESLARARRLVPVAETAMTAAPFRDCAVYIGRLRREICEPTIAARSLGLYRIEDR